MFLRKCSPMPDFLIEKNLSDATVVADKLHSQFAHLLNQPEVEGLGSIGAFSTPYQKLVSLNK